MPLNTPETSPEAATDAQKPSLRAIFLAFFKIGVSAFGGALPWVRRVLVDERGWLSDKEFNEIITVCQAVPGPNVVNVTVFFGARHHGIIGGLVGFVALVGAPLCILLTLNHVYHLFAHVPQVKSAMHGMGIVATSYLVTMALKMGKPFRTKAWAILLCAVAAALSAYAHWPMALVLLLCGAVGVAMSKRGLL
jgi:chromate transporter